MLVLHACVERYRLLGLENRLLDKRDFANDKVDAGELGSGQSACGGGPAARQKQVTSGKLRGGEPLSGARGSCVGMTPSSLSSAPNVLQLAEGVPTETLVLRARAGDRAAESLLYRRFAAGVLSTAVRLVGSVSAGEDVVQDAFLLCLGRLGQLRNPAQFRPWLLSIVVSLSSKRLRRERLLKWVGLDAVADAQLHQHASGVASVEARGELAVLDAVLRRLPVAQRLAWMLRYVEGEKLEDVADAMGKSVSTTKRYVLAAEKHIAAHVALEAP